MVAHTGNKGQINTSFNTSVATHFEHLGLASANFIHILQGYSTHKQLETHRYAHSTVATGSLLLKQQTTSFHSV